MNDFKKRKGKKPRNFFQLLLRDSIFSVVCKSNMKIWFSTWRYFRIISFFCPIRNPLLHTKIIISWSSFSQRISRIVFSYSIFSDVYSVLQLLLLALGNIFLFLTMYYMLYAFLFRRETLRGSSPLLLMMFEWNEQAQKWRAKNLSSLTYTKPRPTFSYTTPAIFSAFKSRTGRRRSLFRPRGGISNMFRPNTRIYDAWMELFPHMPFDQNMNILFGIWYALSQLSYPTLLF